MITRPLFTAATLALGLLAAAPAMAGSTFTARTHGYDNAIDGCTRQGGQWGVYVDGDDNTVEGCVAGLGTRVVTASLGNHTSTHMHAAGFDNQIGSVVRSGSIIDGDFQGDQNEAALYARNGSRVSSSVNGGRNYIRSDAR